MTPVYVLKVKADAKSKLSSVVQSEDIESIPSLIIDAQNHIQEGAFEVEVARLSSDNKEMIYFSTNDTPDGDPMTLDFSADFIKDEFSYLLFVSSSIHGVSNTIHTDTEDLISNIRGRMNFEPDIEIIQEMRLAESKFTLLKENTSFQDRWSDDWWYVVTKVRTNTKGIP